MSSLFRYSGIGDRALITPRNRNSWNGKLPTPPAPPAPTSTPTPTSAPLDEEYVEEYTEHMMSAQMRQLDPLKDDLADWINKTLGIDYVSRDNFLSELDNGVVLCHLAQIISERAQYAIALGTFKGAAPTIRGKCFETAMRRSFFSRDNMANFINFCRSLGVHSNLLFESDDLVLHNQPRAVVLCLLEVARIATRFGVEPPGLVQLEKEIAEEERADDSGLGSLLSWQFQATPAAANARTKMRLSASASALSAYAAATQWSGPPHMVLVPEDPNQGVGGVGGDRLGSDGVPSDHTEEEEEEEEEEDEWSRDSGEYPDREIAGDVAPMKRERNAAMATTTELDRRVQQATRLMHKNCHCVHNKCSKLVVKKVGEGKYNIAGRNVFVRLLKGRHMMVRVGGGWDTLDHFLLRHDPCQVKIVSRVYKDALANTGHSSAPDACKYLHIRAKYRSPPPIAR